MPNWCENDLTVKGKPEDIAQLVEFVKGPDGDFDFNNIVPMLKAFEGMCMGYTTIGGKPYKFWRQNPFAGIEQDELDCLEAEHGATDWHSWAIKNWGTKWNLGKEVGMDFRDTRVDYTFSTAWSPPIPVIAALAERFPKLKFSLKYYECGCAFKGYVKYKKGVLIEEGSGTYSGLRGG